MKFKYQTQHLYITVLHPEQAQLVLDFYIRNRDFLEPLEPARHASFYTLDFQRSNLHCEYHSFLNSSYMRVWLFEKEHPEQAVGTICFSNFLHGAFCSCMVGYKMDRKYLRRGYMAEALSFLLPIVCREYQFHRIEAYVMPSNLPSIRLLEKLGFEQEGYLRQFAQINGNWEDHCLYTYCSPTGNNQ